MALKGAELTLVHSVGHSVEELPFRAMGGIYGSILGSVIIVLILIAQFWVVSYPSALLPAFHEPLLTSALKLGARRRPFRPSVSTLPLRWRVEWSPSSR